MSNDLPVLLIIYSCKQTMSASVLAIYSKSGWAEFFLDSPINPITLYVSTFKLSSGITCGLMLMGKNVVIGL